MKTDTIHVSVDPSQWCHGRERDFVGGTVRYCDRPRGHDGSCRFPLTFFKMPTEPQYVTVSVARATE